MKKWNQPPEVQKPIGTTTLELPLPIPLPLPLPRAFDPIVFECIACCGKSDVLFEGTTYCRPCIKEKLRLGR